MSAEAQGSTKVFISYSWDSDEHKTRVKRLADSLRKQPLGIETFIDEYIKAEEPFTAPKGWAAWMEENIVSAKYVLIVCTETYLRRFQGKEEEG